MYFKDKTHSITTRITEEQYQTLLTLSKLSGLTISAVLQQILDTYVSASKEF